MNEKCSTYCITASSVNIFKNKVDTYLRTAGYTQMVLLDWVILVFSFVTFISILYISKYH